MSLDISFLHQLLSSASDTQLFVNGPTDFGPTPNAIVTGSVPYENYQQFPAPPPPIPAVLPPPPPPHFYHSINTSLAQQMEATMEPQTNGYGRRRFRCNLRNCSVVSTSKATAMTHARRHFGNPKLYECSCAKRFASEDSARRHCGTVDRKVFKCTSCFKQFARKDYLSVHQRKCTTP